MNLADQRWKAKVFFILVGLFLLQGALVYSDYPAEIDQIALSTKGQIGLSIWRSKNCQSCHQIHGFGGFLGPDLTNVTQRLDRRSLEFVLINGRKQMPAFHLDRVQVEQMLTYLDEVNQTGIGYPTLAKSEEGPALVQASMQLSVPMGGNDNNFGNNVQALVDNGCLACHLPFRPGAGPDLSLAATNRSRPYIVDNIKNGRGAMPAYAHLTDAEVEFLVEAVMFLNKNRTHLLRDFGNIHSGKFSLASLPWFEYARSKQ